MQHPFDPSWCARLHARPAPPPQPAPPAEPQAQTPLPPPLRLREVPKEHVCELCGTLMYDHNYKIVCPNCGYKRDCSDP